MQPLDATRAMLDASGVSMYKASIETGHKASYVQSALRKKAIGAHVLADIAAACGYDLCLVPRGGGAPIVIDGTPKQDKADG